MCDGDRIMNVGDVMMLLGAVFSILLLLYIIFIDTDAGFELMFLLVISVSTSIFFSGLLVSNVINEQNLAKRKNLNMRVRKK